jgi:hypothetical protein
MMELTKRAAPAAGRVALAATWEAKEGQSDAVAEILRCMAEAVKTEPGTLLFWPHRSSANDRVFFLYEPKLARRERVQLTPFPHESTIAP